MQNLRNIMKELDTLKIPYNPARDNEVIWCPSFWSRRDYSKVMFLDYDIENDTCRQGFYYKEDGFSTLHIEKEALNEHEALVEIINFYYNEIEK